MGQSILPSLSAIFGPAVRVLHSLQILSLHSLFICLICAYFPFTLHISLHFDHRTPKQDPTAPTMFFRSSVLAAASLTAVAQAQYKIDPETVDMNQRDYWCTMQVETCPLICYESSPDPVLVN